MKTLQDQFIKFQEEQFSVASNKIFTKHEKEKAKEYFNRLISLENIYLLHQNKNSKKSLSIIASLDQLPEFGKTVIMTLFEISKQYENKKELNQIFKNIKSSFIEKNLNTAIILSPKKKKLINELYKMGFFCTGYQLIGDVNKSLNGIKKKTRESELNYKIDFLKKADIEQFINLEIRAHENDPTSRIYKNAKRLVDSEIFRNFLNTFIKNKTCIVLKKDKKIIAAISFFKQPTFTETGLISSISVLPEYQGLGISQDLYRLCLEELKKRKIKYFQGYSTTKNVLSQSKKLNRKVNAIILVAKEK